jgi:nitroimidazol reductase NimA-like FMN-containing flavoprotein (pyridoxamine 5'-phosphate oxidase superfamily)
VIVVTIDERTGMTVMDEPECWDLLRSAPVVRVAAVIGDMLEIFPVNAVVDAGTVVFRTGEGTKLAAVTIARQVVLEADGYDVGEHEAWSVVAVGNADRLDDFDEIYRAESLPLPAWSSHPKQWFVRVSPTRVTGRRFAVAE